MDTTRLLGLECIELTNAAVTLSVTRTVGPRVIGLTLRGGENLFAEAPNLTMDCPGEGVLHLYGGHRLWHAPEIPERTYLPDDRPVGIVKDEYSLLATQPVEEQTGIQKSMRICLPDESPTVVVEHTLTNRGKLPVKCAPWAITMFRTGGVAILPHSIANADPAGVQPNRGLVLWPYTSINSPHIVWGDSFTFVHADLSTERDRLKLGFPNPRGWLAYHYHGTLFVKYAAFHPKESYYDLGSSSQCYCSSHFLELETLASRVHLEPAESVTHREVWRVFGDVTCSPSEEAAGHLARELSLDESVQF